MTKDIPASIVTESQKNAVRNILLLKLEFDSGDVRVHSNLGDVTFNSEVYQGVGTLGTIGGMQENAELSSSQISVSLSGVNNALLSLFLSDDFHGRPATVYFGFMDSSGVLINAFIIFNGFMDTDSIVSGENSTITLKINNNLSLWDRKKLTLNNNEDHQKDFPGDDFFEFVTDLRFKNYAWGRASGDAAGESNPILGEVGGLAGIALAS